MFVGVTAGLLDGRHHERLGAAWMLFLWCCCRQTGQGTEGIVCRGHAVTYADIAGEINAKRSTVRDWMRRLVKQKYIRVERDRRGIRIFILNPKKFRVSKVQHSQSSQSVGTRHSRVSNSQHSQRGYAPRNKATYEMLLRNNLTKQLNNNKSASSPDFSTSEKRRELQEQSERQRLLQEQREKILANPKYAKGNSLGNVVQIQPQEKTA